jgi:hypothetical protein
LKSQGTAAVTKSSGISLEPVKGYAVSPILLIRIVTIAWLTFLIAGSLQPARPSVVKSVHREIHWLGFAMPAILQFIISRTRREEALRGFAIFSVGVALEILQHLMYGIRMEWVDVRDDGIAILAGFALYHLTGAYKARVLSASVPPASSHRSSITNP